MYASQKEGIIQKKDITKNIIPKRAEEKRGKMGKGGMELDMENPSDSVLDLVSANIVEFWFIFHLNIVYTLIICFPFEFRWSITGFQFKGR